MTRVDLKTGQTQRYDLDSEIDSESGAVLAGDDIWLVDIYGRVARFNVESGLLTDRLAFDADFVLGVGAVVYADGGVWLTERFGRSHRHGDGRGDRHDHPGPAARSQASRRIRCG